MSYADYQASLAATYNTAQVVKTKSLPPSGSTNFSDSLNLWDVRKNYVAGDVFSARISFPAVPLADSQTIVATLQTSSDGVSFSDTTNTVTIVGGGGLGSQPTSSQFLITSQFHRWKLFASAGAGDPTQSTATCDVFLG